MVLSVVETPLKCQVSMGKMVELAISNGALEFEKPLNR
jgi:hypothetical protein